MAQRVRKAVLPVAGFGTRFLPATKAMPKEMLTVVDRPLIQYAVEECLAAGIEEFVFVTGRSKGAHRGSFRLAPTSWRRRSQQRGKTRELKQTAGRRPSSRATRSSRASRSRWAWATPCGARATGSGDEPFAVLLPDELTIELADLHRRSSSPRTSKTGGSVVAVMDVPREQTKSYGIAAVKAEEDGLAEITGLVEKPKPAEAPSTLALIGRYVLLPEVFDHLDRHETGAGGEIQLTDAMARDDRRRSRSMRCATPAGATIAAAACGFLEANVAVALHRADTRERRRGRLLERLLKG